MSYVITSGGTAGHINPALAVATELELLGKEVIFAGSTHGMEERLACQAGLGYRAFEARGFNRQRPWTLISSSMVLARSTRTARGWLSEIKAEAVAAFGGYVSVPVGRAAVREGLPLLIHEQNSHMGWSNKHLSRHATAIALSYDNVIDALPEKARERVHVTGNPVRSEFSVLANPEEANQLRMNLRQKLGFTSNSLVVLIFGGSQGARHINQALVELAPELLRRPELCVLHLTGQKEYASVQAALAQKLSSADIHRWQTLAYCDEMPAAFGAADIVVSRAGASSLAELAVAAKPALLVPFPYATANHQHKNAQSLVEAGAAKMIIDSELKSPRFLETLTALIDDESLRQNMLKAAKSLTQANAAKHVAQLLIDIAE
ncbi:MAG: undecaprenyldiphospho-muramoylpentapeptide beta-N-acetylglucosaminyltransferase [Coriobacteriia bacterium]|nr:undecaprenyldiphospho-muramoylpentapeptide beta-N-acetylglucosaminyltransferase [Coriobacteriia bacterium]